MEGFLGVGGAEPEEGAARVVGGGVEAVARIDEGEGEFARFFFEELGDEKGATGDGGRCDEFADGAFGKWREAGNGVAFAGRALLVSGGEAFPELTPEFRNWDGVHVFKRTLKRRWKQDLLEIT